MRERNTESEAARKVLLRKELVSLASVFCRGIVLFGTSVSAPGSASHARRGRGAETFHVNCLARAMYCSM